MTPPPHAIRTHRIELATARRESAHDYLELMSGLWRDRLEAEAEQIFSEHCPAESRVQLGVVELDLGVIPAENFAVDYPRRFCAALRDELRRRVSPAAKDIAGSITPATESPIDLLAHALLHGVLPWWGPAAESFDAGETMRRMLAAAGAQTAAMIRRIGRHERVRFRLVRWLADPEIAALIRALEPAEAEFILRYAEDLQARQEEEQLVPAGSAEFRDAKWDLILGHLLADPGSRFNAKSFLRQTLRGLAARFRVNYASLLIELVRTAGAAGTVWRESSLPRLLGDLLDEDVQRGEVPATEQTPESDVPIVFETNGRTEDEPPAALEPRAWAEPERAMPALREWFETGRLPQEPRFAPWHMHPEEWAYLALAEHAAEAPRLLRQWARAGRLIRPMAERFSDEVLGAVVETIEPVHAESVTTFVATAVKHHADEPAMTKSTAAFRIDVWEVVLGYLLLGHSSVFQTQMFLAYSIDAIGRRHGVSAKFVLDFLCAAANRQGKHALLADLRLLATRREYRSGTQTTEEPNEAFGENARSAGDDETSKESRSGTRALAELCAAPATWMDAGKPEMEECIRQLAARHGRTIVAMLRLLLTAAENRDVPPGLRARLQILAAQESASGAGAPVELANGAASSESLLRAAATEPLPGLPPHYFTAERLQHSMRARVWLLRLVLADATAAASPRIAALLPEIWKQIARGPGHGVMRELILHRTVSLKAIEQAMRTGGEPALEQAVFSGQRTIAAAWREALDWLEQSPAAAALFPGGRAGLRAALWGALVGQWRAQGGRLPAESFGRLLLLRVMCAVMVARAGNSSAASAGFEEKLRVALAGDASAGARRLLRLLAPDPGPGRERTHTGKADAGSRRDDHEDRQVEAGAEPIFVANAGLVLLAPFFPPLHERCGLLEERLFRDARAAQRAVHLLQYLVTGGGRAHEYTLALNKVLCGLDSAQPVMPTLALTEQEMARANDLLRTAIERWPKVNKTSVDGVRNSFLWRRGKLEFKQERWTLMVETRGWDVLIAEAPWSFSVIKPAWMPHPLHVNWI